MNKTVRESLEAVVKEVIAMPGMPGHVIDCEIHMPPSFQKELGMDRYNGIPIYSDISENERTIWIMYEGKTLQGIRVQP